MTTFRLTINCDGADLHDAHPHALARTLVELGHAIAAGRMPETVRDANGNSVGTVELTDTDPPDMEQIRNLVSEFADDLGNGSGFGDSTLVDSATLRRLYNLVFGLTDDEEQEDEDEDERDPDDEAICDECGESYRWGDRTEGPGLEGMVCLRCAVEFDLLPGDD